MGQQIYHKCRLWRGFWTHIWVLLDLPGLSFRILETVSFTLQHVIANRYKSGASVFSEQISATPELPRQQPALATSESSCKCEDNYQILPCFYSLAYYLLEARFSLASEDSGQTLKVISPRRL